MNMPNLVRHGLCHDFEGDSKSEAIDMLYNHVKKSPKEISEMIRETWIYIKKGNTNHLILSHFLYLLSKEVERAWVNDIALEIVQYGLNSKDMNVVDQAIGLVETWNDNDMLDLLHHTEIPVEWLRKYQRAVLRGFEGV